MSFLTGAKTGAEQSPWSAVLNEVNASYERRRKEDAERDAEERKLKNLFTELNKREELARETQRQKGEQDIEKEYVKGEIEGSLRPTQAAPMAGTPMGAVGQAMQPVEPKIKSSDGSVSLSIPANEDTTRSQQIGAGIAQQAGLAPRVLKSPSGREYEQVDRNTEIPEGMEIVGYDQKGRPMIRKVSTADKKFAAEQEEKNKVQEAKSQMVLDTAQDTLNTIAEVEKGINNFGTFGNLPSIPGTSRRTWESNIDKLLSSKILNTISTMKEASKTGATGFGQLNLKELEVLQKASTALKKDLPKEDAQKYINDIKTAVQKIVEKKTDGAGAGDEYDAYLQAIGAK